MIINHNMNALNAHRNMVSNTATSGKSMEKLSSGLRINRAGDDAAGLAISEKMRGQIRGLDQASRNAQDGISMIQTAEGALNETHSILQRMRELSVQSGNDTNNASDREQIQKEMDQLTEEIDRIANTTEFNTKKLLNGSAGIGAEVTGAAAGKIEITGGTGDTKTGTIDLKDTAINKSTNSTSSVANALDAAGSKLASALELTINDKSYKFAADTTIDELNKALKDAGVQVEANGTTKTTLNIKSVETGTGSVFKGTAKVGNGTATALTVAAGQNATITGTGTLAAEQYTAKGDVITIQSGQYKGLEIKVSDNVAAAAGNAINVTGNGSLSLQIGANEGQTVGLSIADMRAEALGVNNIDVTTSQNAEKAVTTIQTAIDSVSSERSKLGAMQNRLEHTINNLGTSSENLTAAESRVRDVDMAKEMMTFSKNNILAQAAQSMLAQANQQPQQVLSLLR